MRGGGRSGREARAIDRSLSLTIRSEDKPGSRLNDDCGVTPIAANSDTSAASDVWQAELRAHVDAPSRVLCIGHTWPGPTPGQQAPCESDSGAGVFDQRTIGAAARPASWRTIQELTARRSAFRTVLVTSYNGS